MTDVFLSYRNTPERRALVKRLATILRMNGVDTWWDYGLEAGESFRNQIMAALNAAKVVTPLWCEESIDRQWVVMEAEMAKDKLVPARLQDVVPPAEFSAIQSANLVGWDGGVDHPGLVSLINKIRSKLGNTRPVPLDLIDELRSLPRIEPLPKPSPAAAQALAAQVDMLSDLRRTWDSFPARDDADSLERFLIHVRSVSPSSGLVFEVEHRLIGVKSAAGANEQTAHREKMRLDRAARAASANAEWLSGLDTLKNQISTLRAGLQGQSGGFDDYRRQLVSLVSQMRPMPSASVASIAAEPLGVAALWTWRAHALHDMPPSTAEIALWFPSEAEAAAISKITLQGLGAVFCVRPGVILHETLIDHPQVHAECTAEEIAYYPKTTVYIEPELAFADSDND